MKNPILFTLASLLLLCQCKEKETSAPTVPAPEEETKAVFKQVRIAARTGNNTTYNITHYKYSSNDTAERTGIQSNQPVDISISDNDVLIFSANNHIPVTIDFLSGSIWIDSLKLSMRNTSGSTQCNNYRNKTLSGIARARINDSSTQPVNIGYHRNGARIANVSSNTTNFGYTININDTTDNQCIKDLRFTTISSNRKARIFITSVSSDNIELDVFLDDSTSGVPGSDQAPKDNSKHQ